MKDEGVKKEIQNSIEFLEKTRLVSQDIKDKVVFITFDIERLFDSEILGFNYSTSIPLSWATLNKNGQFIFHNDSYNNWLFFNYSPHIVLIFRGDLDYFNQNELKQLSNLTFIRKADLITSEYFTYNKGNEFTEDFVENGVSMDRVNGDFILKKVYTFDLKTFMEVWYGLDVNEIPVSQDGKECSGKNKFNNIHTHPTDR